MKYLKADLQRIVDSANEELAVIRRARMADPIRQVEEARVVNGARAFAARRVESTVRHLRKVAREFPVEYRPMNPPEETEKTRVLTAIANPAAEPETVRPMPMPTSTTDSNDTEVLEEIATVLAEISTLAEPTVDAEPPVDKGASQPSTGRHAAPAAAEVVTTHHSKRLVEPESDRERLERLLKFVAHQEPGLRWAVGNRADGTTLLVTDLANGWIPSGITLPAGVRLLEPQRRTGNAAALLGQTTLSVTYAPGDPLGWATDYDDSETSSQPRELSQIDDLGWVLSEATHWRDGLPRMVHTLAKAGAAGTGVVEAEIDLLRVYLDTARYQLLAEYPDVDAALLLNCLLLAATEGIASGDLVIANYHFAWFQILSTPPASRWKASS